MSRLGNELYRGLSRALLLGTGLVVALWFLYEIRRGLLLLIVAVVLAMALNAPVTWLERRGVPRGGAVAGVFLALIALGAGLAWLVLPRLVSEVPRFLEEIPQLVTDLAARLSNAFGDHPEVERQLSNVVQMVLQAVGGVWQYATGLVMSLLLVIILMGLVLFLLADPRPLIAGYLRMMAPDRRPAAARALARSSRMVVGWVGANVILGGIKAVASVLFLTWMGIPGAVLWSVVSFFGALVPRIGFYVMAVPPVLVALSIDFQTALWVGLFYWILSELLGAVIAPRIQGETMQLHPAYLLFMAIALALPFGLVGVLVSAPVAGFLKAYFDEFYLAGRPEVEPADTRVEAILRTDVGSLAE